MKALSKLFGKSKKSRGKVTDEDAILERSQPFEPEMILIPAGKFLMGSDPRKDNEATEAEQPQHTLYLPDYYLAKTPVTNAQYAAFVRASTTGREPPDYWEGDKPPGGKEDHPVVNVSWYDAVAYCDWLSQVTGKRYCLPSEAEWEKGARGTDGRIYPWGNQWDASLCRREQDGQEDTTSVGAYPRGASPYGLLDMVSNVLEWTRSAWGETMWDPLFKYPYDPADGREDLRSRALRVRRGSMSKTDRKYARCASRHTMISPQVRHMGTGFRVCVRGR